MDSYSFFLSRGRKKILESVIFFLNLFIFFPVRQAWMVVRSDGCFISLSKLTVPFAGFLLQLVFKGSDT